MRVFPVLLVVLALVGLGLCDDRPAQRDPGFPRLEQGT